MNFAKATERERYALISRFTNQSHSGGWREVQRGRLFQASPSKSPAAGELADAE